MKKKRNVLFLIIVLIGFFQVFTISNLKNEPNLNSNDKAESLYSTELRTNSWNCWDTNMFASDAPTIITGEDTSHDSGSEVAGVGDVDGDGQEDIMVAANMYDQGALTEAGKIYLFLNTPTGSIDIDSADASYYGEGMNDILGTSFSNGGDIDNDGYDDLLVSAAGYDTTRGKIYLFFGRPESQWGLDQNVSNADVAFLGENTNDLAGSSVCILEDINGDNYDDILIGASYYSGTDDGKAYLFFGRPANEWKSEISLADANSTHTGGAAGNHLGSSVANAGDLNGDGFNDFVIGENGYSGNTGRVHIYSGQPTSFWTSVLPEVAAWNGEDTSHLYGTDVAGAGDVNNDGYDDFIVGANGYYSSTGRSYLFFGKSGFPDTNVSFTGESTSDNAGRCVSIAGDVNGDGYDDILIGAYMYNWGSTSNVGKTYLIYGRKTSDWSHMDLINADAAFTGEEADTRLGASCAIVNDLTGEGLDDIIVGAPMYSSDTGRSYIFTWPNPYPFTLSSDAREPDSNGDFDLDWTDSQGAVSYSIFVEYHSETNSPTVLLANGVTQSGYSISGFGDGLYTFTVVAINSYGNTTSNSITVSIMISDEEDDDEGDDEGDLTIEDIASLLEDPTIQLFVVSGLIITACLLLIIGVLVGRKTKKAIELPESKAKQKETKLKPKETQPTKRK